MEDKFAYNVQWTDPRTKVVWQYELLFFPETGEVEMVDVKNRRLFLKRCLVAGNRMVPELLRPGATVTLLSRQLVVVDYADEFTRSHLQSKQERTLAMIKPDAVQHFGSILELIQDAGFVIGEVRMCLLTQVEAARFYAVHQQQAFFPRLLEFMTSGRVVAMELLAEGAVAKWRSLLGPTDSEAARQGAPTSIRALFGSDKTRNACHGSDAVQTAAQECDFFFRQQVGKCWGLQADAALCLVKPHALISGHLPAIVCSLSDHFLVTAATSRHFDMQSAGELLEVYKRALPLSEYSSMVEELCSGTSVAIEVSSMPGAVVTAAEGLRQLCGPADPLLATALRPGTLRAAFGASKALNAVHCTDLEEDAALDLARAFD